MRSFAVRGSLLAGLALVVGVIGSAMTPQEALAGGGCRGMKSTTGTGDAVAMSGTCFVPTVLHVEPGTKVTFTNESTEPHNVAGATIEWGNYDELRNGESVSHTFAKTGTYPYYCFVHNGMIGAIVVGDGDSIAVGASTSSSSDSVVAASVRRAPAPGVLESAPAAAETSSIAAEADGGGSELAFAGLGVLIGAVAVGAGFGWRNLRRG